MKSSVRFANAIVAVACLFSATAARAVTNVFFSVSQSMFVVSSNFNAVTIQSGDYRFTYSADGYFTGGVGLTNPVGRFFSVNWPTGVQAQAITVGPLLGTGANITLKRVDGKPFGLQSFTGKILLNTAGAGAAFEIMPLLNGNDAFPDPLQYDCSGYGGQSFSYTPSLNNYDTYQVHMWGDFALTALSFIDTNPPLPVVSNFTVTGTASPVDGGSLSGAGIYASNTPCTLTATPNVGWGLKNWTQNGTQVSTSLAYTFTVRSTRDLVANFVPAYNLNVAASPNYGAATLTGSGTFNSNSTITARATPAKGFKFLNWTEYGNPTPLSTSTNYSFNITSARSLIANFAPLPQTAIFDFDTGSPTLSAAQAVVGSVTQSNRGVTATISPVMGGWYFQSISSSIVGAPGDFTGLLISPTEFFSSMQIQFSEPLTDCSFDFRTGESITEYTWPGVMRLTAYTNSTATLAIGTIDVQGAWKTHTFPEGHLAFHSATSFNVVVIEMAPLYIPSWLFSVDNIVVERASFTVPTNVTITASASPAVAGTTTGFGVYLSGDTVSVSASPNLGFVFVDWTVDGTEVSATPDYTFTANSDLALVANFATNTPPVALGGSFYQLTGQPLTISIWDLMAFDHDPDNGNVSFVGASTTSSNGLALTVDTNAMQILVPANTVADSFSYTIADDNGGSATGAATISIITGPTSQANALDLSVPGVVSASFTGVPWYYYECQRATNATFTGTLQTWPVKARADGSIYIWDDFADLTSKPPQAFYRLQFNP